MTVKRYNAGCAYAGEEEMVQVDDGAYVSHEDYAALLKERDALAAENAALKYKAAELVHEASEIYSAYNATITEPDGDFMDMQTLQEMQCIGTTATDAAIANIQAQGVEKLATFAGKEYQRFVGDKTLQRKWKGIVLLCTDFASQLRKESNHD